MQIESSILNDGRVRLLSSTNRGRFTTLVILADDDGNLPDIYTIAANLGVRLSAVDSLMADLEKVGLVVRDTMHICVSEHKPKPLTVAERVAAHRARKRVTTSNDDVTPTLPSVTPALHDVTSRYTPALPPESPQTPLGKKQDKPESNSLSIPPTPKTTEKASEEDGNLGPYPETRAALEDFPAIPTQAQLLALTGQLRKRGDAPVAAFVRSVTERHSRDPSKIYAPVGFLLKELETRKEPPVTTRKAANPDLYIGGEASTLAAWRPKVSEWVKQHGEPQTYEQREAMWEQTGVDYAVFAEMLRSAN